MWLVALMNAKSTKRPIDNLRLAHFSVHTKIWITHTGGIVTLWYFILFCHRKCFLFPKRNPLGPAVAHRPSDFIWEVWAAGGSSKCWRPEVGSPRLGCSEIFPEHKWRVRHRRNSRGSRRWILSGGRQRVHRGGFHTWIDEIVLTLGGPQSAESID